MLVEESLRHEIIVKPLVGKTSTYDVMQSALSVVGGKPILREHPLRY